MEECILVHEGRKKNNLGLLSAHGETWLEHAKAEKIKKNENGPLQNSILGLNLCCRS